MPDDPIFLSSDPADSDSDSISVTSTVQSEQDPDQTYLCERILARKTDPRTRRPVYLVKWEGYPMERCTWEPPDMFESSSIIEDFERRYRRRERRRKGLGPTESETEEMAEREERRRLRREKEARGEEVEEDTEDDTSDEEEFDWRAWDKEQERLASEKEERQRRRRAKRERIEAKKAMVFMEKGKRRVSARQEGRRERRGPNAAEMLRGFVVDDDVVEYSSSDTGLFDDTETEEDDEDDDEDGEVRPPGRRRRKAGKEAEGTRKKRTPSATRERKVPKKRPLAVSKSPPRPAKVQRKDGQSDAAGKKRQSDAGMSSRKEGAASKRGTTPRQEKQAQGTANAKKPQSSAKSKTPTTNTGAATATNKPPSAQNATPTNTNPRKGLLPNKKKAPVVARAKKQSNQLSNAQGPRTYDKLSIQYRAQKRSNMEPEPDRAALELVRPGEPMSNPLIFNKRPENRAAPPAPPQHQQTPPAAPGPAPMATMAPIAPTMTAGSLIQELTEKHLKAQEERAADDQAKRDRAELQRKAAEARAEARAKAQDMVRAAGRDKPPHRVTFQEPERRKDSPKPPFVEPVRSPEAEKRKRSPPPGIPSPLPSGAGHVGSPPRKRVAFQGPEPSPEYDPMMLDDMVPPPPLPVDTEMVDVRPAAPFGKLKFECELVYGPGSASAGRVVFVGFGSEFVRFLKKEGVDVMKISHSLESSYLAQIFVPEVGVPLEYADLQGDMNQLEPIEHALTSFNGAGVITTEQFTIMVYLARNSALTKAFKAPGVSTGVMYRAVAYPPLDLPKPSSTPQLIPDPTLKDYASQLFVATRNVDLQEYLPRKDKDGRPRRIETIIIAPHFAVRESFDLRLTLERLNIHISEAAKTIPKITKDNEPMYLNIFVHSHYRDKLHLIPEFRGLHFATLKNNRCTYTFFGTHLTHDPETGLPVLRNNWEKFWRWGTLIFMTPAYVLSHEHALALVLKYTRLKAATTALCIPDFLFQRVTDTILSMSTAALDPNTNQANELGRRNNTILRNLFELEDDFHDRAKKERGYQMIQLLPRAERYNEFEALLDELTRISNEQAAEFRRFVVCRDPEVDREGKGQVRGRLEFMDRRDVERRLGVSMEDRRLGAPAQGQGQGGPGQAGQGRPGTPGQQAQQGQPAHPLPPRPPSAHQGPPPQPASAQQQQQQQRTG